MTSAGNFKIFNGREVQPGTYPWVGWIKENSTRRVHCGATLVAKRFALTAASCCDGSIATVVFGDHRRSENEGTEQEIAIESVTKHPDFDPVTFANDVALLELAEEVDTDRDNVDVLPLLPEDRLTKRILRKRCRVAGWGYEVEGQTTKGKDQSDVLLELVVDVNETCSGAVPEGAKCFKPFRDPTSLTCAGDVGGPFMCKRRQKWVLTGVFSGWNIDAGCQPGYRSATLLPNLVAWIDTAFNIQTEITSFT